MKSLLVENWTTFDQLELRDIPVPDVPDNGVRITTQAAGVAFATSLVVQGKYQRKPPLPFAPGTEVTGIVSETGPAATRFAVGDRVCAVLDWGGLAQECVAQEATVFKLPDNLDFTRGICFTNSYGTSAAALTWPHLLNVQAGQTLLVHGATGGVGIAAVEIGKLLGATVIATAGTDEKLGIAKQHGADHAINYRSDDFRQAVLDLTGGAGANAIYDPVGGDVFMQSLRCIAPEGRIMPVGFAGGTIAQIPANLLLVKNITVCGLNMGYYYGWSPNDVRHQYEGRLRETMDKLFAWFEAGHLNPRVSATYAFDDVFKAMDDVLERRAIGRVAVVMDTEAKRLGL